MAPAEIDLLAIDRGAVTAPAGCGKTHLIAEALTRHSGRKPILVLTHTNAGVAALRGRLNAAQVPPTAYRLLTLDGWAMRLIATFPKRSGLAPELLKLANPAVDYPNVRNCAVSLVKSGHINGVLTASYARVIVDEYQDCSLRQHALVGNAAKILRTCVLGDPLQAIFGFGQDGLARWKEHVLSFFPLAGELATPWRWINAGTEPLGRWLLELRGALVRGEPVDLRTAPGHYVSWVELDGRDDIGRRLDAARVEAPTETGSVLIIGDSRNPESQRQFARSTPGAVTVEAVDLKDLTSFSAAFNLAAPDAIDRLAKFAESVMGNVSAQDVVRRVRAAAAHGRGPASDVERAGIQFVESPSYDASLDLLVEIGKEIGVRTHRPGILKACIGALGACNANAGLTFRDSVVQIREQNRLLGRPLPKRAVGSTLLIKGLEADVVVILDAESLSVPNLYVAMTRGSRAIVVCSRSPVLRPTS